MTKVLFQVRWLMIMSQVTSWAEFTALWAKRYVIQSSLILKGFVTAANIKRLVRLMKKFR